MLILAITLLFFLNQLLFASATTAGQLKTFQSPNNITERCVILNHIPGGDYSKKDKETEKTYCAIDLYSPDTAICPKVWSTSPGTIIHDVSAGEFAQKPGQFERQICGKGKKAKSYSAGKPVDFKNTMNQRDTSATFSTASLLYYHFSRYFQTHIKVPVAVQRTIDKDEHRKRVTHRGIQLTSPKGGTHMIHAAWVDMDQVQKSPADYKPTDELFTPDRKQIYGVLLHSPGKRYSAVINGTRKSGWGEGQNRDFQRTPAYLALRSNLPLAEAIKKGIGEARKDHAMAKAMSSGISDEQMVFWMQELTEITLLDFIFSQQDRIGNIDYLDYWYWIENSQVKRKKAKSKKAPEKITRFNPVLLKRTQLNDNDAGGKIQYANYTKTTGMLKGLHHYNPVTYKKLIDLDKDFQEKGELYRYTAETFGLTERQLNQVIENTHKAASILKSSCESGAIRFDLDPVSYFSTKAGKSGVVDCKNP